MTRPFTTRTASVRAGIGTDRQHGAVVPPLHLSSNFTFAGFAEKRAYDYSRTGNPTRDELAVAIARLEGGARAVITPSGMAAITLVLHLCSRGERVVAPHDGYGGTWRLLDAFRKKGFLDVELVDQADLAAVDRALGDGARVLWIETPSNPHLRVYDIEALAARAHAAGALVAVDNTFLSPVLQRPLELGADLVVHSTTKYLNGHSDVVGGAVIARDAALGDEVAWWANCLGVCGAPFDAWLTLRGLRTLHARMRAHEENARAVLAALDGHRAVAAIHHPSRPDHPQHALARRQQQGFGPMLSFDLVGGEAAARAFCDGLACFSLAESLGGVESLVAHPATMTHAAMSDAARAVAGIGPGLLRLSVGLEDPDDLVADVGAALDRAARATAMVGATR